MSWFLSQIWRHEERLGVLNWDAIRKRNRPSSDSWILDSFWCPQPWSHITTCPSTASKQERLVIHCLRVDTYKKGRISRLIWNIIMQCFACVHTQLIQLYLTLCDPMDSSPSGSSVHGILQARILEWVAMTSSRGFSWPRNQTCVSWVFCIAGEFFTFWATWEALVSLLYVYNFLQEENMLVLIKKNWRMFKQSFL